MKRKLDLIMMWIECYVQPWMVIVATGAILTMLVALLPGCMSFVYEKPDGTKVSYVAPALFGRQVDKLSAVRDGDDILFELEKYKSETAADVFEAGLTRQAIGGRSEWKGKR